MEWLTRLGLRKNLSSSTKPSLAIITAFFMVMVIFSCMDLLTERGTVSSTFAATKSPSSRLPHTIYLEPPAQRLVQALQMTVSAVAKKTGVNPETDFSLEQWRRNNSCQSRTELLSLYDHLSNRPNRKSLGNFDTSQWKTVLQEYEKLHRVCTKAAGNLTEYFYAQKTSTGCKFLIADSKNGMGNKLFIMAPAVLYAILTQRVILVPVSNHMPGIMCEPFPGSTWKLSQDLQDRSIAIWNSTREFMTNVDTTKREHEITLPIYASRVDDDWQPESRFFCDVEQAYFRNVPWLSVSGCLYFLPKLFAIPSFRPTLEALFPDPSLALTQILRSFFLPADPIWARVKSVERHYLDGTLRQVGIQARYFNNSAGKHKVVNANVAACLFENNVLRQSLHVHKSTQHEIKVFIASLTGDLRDQLHVIYNRSTEDENIKVEQLSIENLQRFGLEGFSQALLEIICLSLSDTLLVTPTSSYGGLAQAYGALTPWFIETRDDMKVPCELAQTVDGCYQIPDMYYHCPYDSKLDMKHIVDNVPYIKYCLQIDHGRGLQLVDALRNTSTTAG